MRTRVALHDLPGFHQPAPNEKIKKVDLGAHPGTFRTLVTAKWSIRADREEQFMSDFQTYERLEAAGEDFAYVLVTNEFDAARLRAACERRRQNAPLFCHVVHINPTALSVVYQDAQSEGLGGREETTSRKAGSSASRPGCRGFNCPCDQLVTHAKRAIISSGLTNRWGICRQIGSFANVSSATWAQRIGYLSTPLQSLRWCLTSQAIPSRTLTIISGRNGDKISLSAHCPRFCALVPME